MEVSSKPLRKILWIEDGAKYELREFLGAVHYSGKCNLKLAQDASQAMDLLTTQKFDAVIVDIRLAPGYHRDWQNLYQKNGRDKIIAQLGLRLLEWLCVPTGKMRQSIQSTPQEVNPDRIAVFTIESYYDIGVQLEELHIRIFEQKKTTTPDTILLNIIDRLLPENRVD